MKTLCFIPTYRCQKHLPSLLPAVRKHVADSVDEIILVDNQSDDQTLSVARDLRESLGFRNFSLIANVGNYGLGGSHKVAIQYAVEHGYTHLLVLHGDDQADPSEAPELLNAQKNEPELDAVLGIRFADPKLLHGYSKFRTLGNQALNGLFSLILGKKVDDLGSGLNLFSVRRLRELDLETYSDFCDFNIYLLIDMLKNDWRIRSLPITWRQDDQVSTNRAVEMGYRALKILFSRGLTRHANRSPSLRFRAYSKS